MERIQILLVDSNHDDASVLRRVFARAHDKEWQVVQVERLEEAIHICQEYATLTQGNNAFDIVLLELCLPDSSRLDTVTRFYAAIPDVPIVVLTTLDDEELALHAITAGAQDYLVKDRTTIHQLTKSIFYAIARSRKEEHCSEPSL